VDDEDADCPGLKEWIRLRASTPAEARHHEVEHDRVRAAPRLTYRRASSPFEAASTSKPASRKDLDEDLPDVAVVIHDQHSHDQPLSPRRERPARTLTPRNASRARDVAGR